MLDAHKNPMAHSIQPIGLWGRRETMIVPTVNDVTVHAASGTMMIRPPCSASSSERTENTTVNSHNDQATPVVKRDLIAPRSSLACAATKRRAQAALSPAPPR